MLSKQVWLLCRWLNRNMGKLDNLVRRNVGEFLRLQLMEPATIDPARHRQVNSLAPDLSGFGSQRPLTLSERTTEVNSHPNVRNRVVSRRRGVVP